MANLFLVKLSKQFCCGLLFFALATFARAETPPSRPERLNVIAARVEEGCRSVEAGLTVTNPQPSIRQLSSCALGWFELDIELHRPEALMRYVFDLQNMNRWSAGYGTVPWQQGHPEIKDPNAIEFTMQPVAVIFLRHENKLSESFKNEARPHLRAAISAIRRHPVPVKYSNIYLMKLVNLLLLGQAMGDSEAVAEGRAKFDAWLAFTRKNGVVEYDSPTYSPIQADCLALAHNLTNDLELKKKLKGALDFYWTDFAANYFEGRKTMSGPSSRNYNNGFLFSDSNIDYLYYLAGLSSISPADTFLSDKVRTWTVARMGGYEPPAAILALATLPERVIKSKFGEKPGQDRYEFITPDFSIGSASAYYGPQDRPICVEFSTDKKLPLIGFVADALDNPFGIVRSKDRGGHSKPHNLPHRITTVQEKGFLLGLTDVSLALRYGNATNLASNIILPVQVDQLWLDGNLLVVTNKFQYVATSKSVVALREGKGSVAIRLFAADGCSGQTPTWKLEFDGNEQGAGRFAVHHYRGSSGKLLDKYVRVGFVVLAQRCETDEEFLAFLKRVGEINVQETMQADVWCVAASLQDVQLKTGLNLNNKQISSRFVNGKTWQPEVLEINGRDIASKNLGGE